MKKYLIIILLVFIFCPHSYIFSCIGPSDASIGLKTDKDGIVSKDISAYYPGFTVFDKDHMKAVGCRFYPKDLVTSGLSYKTDISYLKGAKKASVKVGDYDIPINFSPSNYSTTICIPHESDLESGYSMYALDIDSSFKSYFSSNTTSSKEILINKYKEIGGLKAVLYIDEKPIINAYIQYEPPRGPCGGSALSGTKQGFWQKIINWFKNI